MPAGVAHLEALLVLPEHVLRRHVLQQSRYLATLAPQQKVLPMPTYTLGGVLRVSVLTCSAKRHAHGYALLGALQGNR